MKKMKKRKKGKTAVNRLLLRKEFLDVNEVAALLGVIKRSVWRFRAAKQIPEPYKVADKTSGQIRTRWKTSELRRWIAQGCPGTQTTQSKRKIAADGRTISSKLLRHKKLLNLREMMAFLGVSRRTVWRFISTKRIPAPHKIWNESAKGMRLVWKTGELRQWVERGCPSEDTSTIKFGRKNQIHAAMLSNRHGQQRVSQIKKRIKQWIADKA